MDNHMILIGMDVHGVIMDKFDKSKSVEEYLTTVPLKHATTVIKNIIDLYGPENTFIISKCPMYAEDEIIKWLDNQNFFTEIGFIRSNVYFCRERTDKAPVAKQLRLTHFIDDRVDVLNAMKDVVSNRILFTGGGNHEESDDKTITELDNWDSVQDYITKTVY
jgi:hypothetical protein